MLSIIIHDVLFMQCKIVPVRLIVRGKEDHPLQYQHQVSEEGFVIWAVIIIFSTKLHWTVTTRQQVTVIPPVLEKIHIYRRESQDNEVIKFKA